MWVVCVHTHVRVCLWWEGASLLSCCLRPGRAWQEGEVCAVWLGTFCKAGINPAYARVQPSEGNCKAEYQCGVREILTRMSAASSHYGGGALGRGGEGN